MKRIINKRGLVRFFVKFINFVMPYGIIEYRRKLKEESPNSFLSGYIDFKKKEFKDNVINKNFKHVIAVSGFGYSGSGAVFDLLAECDNCLAVGHNEKNRYDNVDYPLGYETDIIRLAGGLYEIEKYIGCHNIFLNDALLNRFIKCAEYFPPFRENLKIRNCFFAFFRKIVELDILKMNRNAYNPYLYPHKKKSNIFFLKDLSIDEFRSISNSFLINLFNELNTSNSDYLVFDQLLSDLEFDDNRNRSYINDVKTIIVYRDPRDIYTFAKQTGLSWIPHDNVDDFIKWYKIMVARIDIANNGCLIVQFEKLVTDYETEVKRIFKYIGLDPQNHNKENKFRYFNPKFSIRNVGKWKSCDIKSSDFEKIYDEISDFCFHP